MATEIQPDTSVTSAGQTSSPYTDLIKDYLTAEDARIASVEQRGVAVITTSGALVTLLFGLVAVITKAQDYKLPGWALPFLIVGLAGFFIAAVFGIWANLPIWYEDLDAARLDTPRMLQDPPERAQRKILRLRVKVLASTQHVVTVKAKRLRYALWAEVGAVFMVALAVIVILVAAR